MSKIDFGSAAEFCEAVYNVYFNRDPAESLFFSCPMCDEVLSYEDEKYAHVDNWMTCPHCGFNFYEGNFSSAYDLAGFQPYSSALVPKPGVNYRIATFVANLNKHDLTVTDFLDIKEAWERLSHADRESMLLEEIKYNRT